jgi:hypothetical protein
MFLVSVRTTTQCTMCGPVKYVASRVAQHLNLTYQEIQPPEPTFQHAVPVVALGNQILYAPTPAHLDIHEAVLKAAVQHAMKYSTAT